MWKMARIAVSALTVMALSGALAGCASTSLEPNTITKNVPNSEVMVKVNGKQLSADDWQVACRYEPPRAGKYRAVVHSVLNSKSAGFNMALQGETMTDLNRVALRYNAQDENGKNIQLVFEDGFDKPSVSNSKSLITIGNDKFYVVRQKRKVNFIGGVFMTQYFLNDKGNPIYDERTTAYRHFEVEFKPEKC